MSFEDIKNRKMYNGIIFFNIFLNTSWKTTDVLYHIFLPWKQRGGMSVDRNIEWL